MLVVAFVSFSLFNFVGDPINNMVGEETSDEERGELREKLGLNEPIHIQSARLPGLSKRSTYSCRENLNRLCPKVYF